MPPIVPPGREGSTDEAGERLERVGAALEDRGDRFEEGKAHPAAGRELPGQRHGADPLDDARDRGERFVAGAAAGQLLAHLAVAAVIAQAGADQIAEPGEAVKGGAPAAERRAEPGELREGAADDRRLGVEA